MNKLQPSIIKDNEIDLFELWTIIIKHKIIIFTVTVIATITATIYTWIITPVYNGNVLIELGEIVNNSRDSKVYEPTSIINLDNVYNLKEVISQSTGTNVFIPAGTTNILKLSVENSNPSEIKLKLEDAVNFIIARHQEKAKLYQNNNSKIRMTQVIGDIQIGSDLIKSKKQLIISIGFISGLILGIFFAFFLEFIGARRNR